MSTPQIPADQQMPEYLAQDISKHLLNLSISFIIVLTVFYILYSASRIIIRERGIDTWFLMPAAYLFCIGNCIVGILMVMIGGAGRHKAYHLLHDPNIVATYLKLSVAAQTIYVFSSQFPKLAIICLYLRIFVGKWSRRITVYTGVFVVCNIIVLLVLVTTLCQPLAYTWDKTIKGGKCFNITATYRYSSVPNILSDLVILVLPMPTLRKLNVSFIKKLAIFLTFLTGSLGIITTILRFVNYLTVDFQSDRTYRSIVTMTWTITEPACYFMCACMPGMRPLLQKAYESCKPKDKVGRPLLERHIPQAA